MKTPKLSLLFIFVIGLYFPAAAQNKKEEEKVKSVIIDFFQALSDAELVKMRTYGTPDFLLLEHGEIWTMDILESKIKPRVGSNSKRTNKFEFINVKIQGKTAWVSYHNEAHIVRDTNVRDVKWLESAVLQKTKQGWKINLLHSTIKPAATN